ncbi:primosomal protein DnaI [Lacticigenium naphthae]|uniref:primosomal protein DnaI n=1 Tax=Lacticigenium naphthae TaxID=515351 RepID=UPI0004168301|nr:primosomal protein DnaI [Lacticigenium naphthae]
MENVGKNFKNLMSKNDLDRQLGVLMETVLKDPEVYHFLKEHKDELTTEGIERSYSELYEFVQEKRKFGKNEKDRVAPGYRPQLIASQGGVAVQYIPTTDLLEKRKQMELKQRITAVDMPKDIREADLKDFEPTKTRQQAIQEALAFIENYIEKPKAFHKALYLQGPFGVGKTYLLGAIAHALAKNGYPSTLIHFPTFAVEMKNSIGNNTTASKIEEIKRTSILMIDDIGADSLSSWIRDDILGVILQHRMQEELPTFFSSNFSMKQLEEEHLRISQRGEDEPLKAKRIMERIKFLSKEIKMAGRNRRY